MITTRITSRTRPIPSSTASESLTDATIAAIATPTTVPAIRANVRFTEASAPNWVTASTVNTSQAPLDPGRQISTPRVLAVHSTVIVIV